MNKTLYCAISAHGFGHLAQSVPILGALKESDDSLRIIVQSAIEYEQLQTMLPIEFEYVQAEADFGMVMDSALDIDVEASHTRYCLFHGAWQQQVSHFVELIKPFKPDLIYSNISYLVNAAACQLSIPVINLCSLNWHDIYRGYCEGMSGATEVLDDMHTAYNYAQNFLLPEPSMPMPAIKKVEPIDTVARIGKSYNAQVRSQLDLRPDDKLVLVSHGGVELPIDFKQWPQTKGIYYIVDRGAAIQRDDFISAEQTGLKYIDLIATVDAIITKPGYGIFTEAACNGLPVLYTRRPDWPEEACLVEWLQRKHICIEISRQELLQGEFVEKLLQLLVQDKKPLVKADGVQQAVHAIQQLL